MEDMAKLNKFKEVVLEDAKQKRNAIEEATNKKKDVALEKAEENILEEAYKMIQNEVSEIKSDIGRELSLHNIESRKEVLAEREHYVEVVFSEVKKQLVKFTKTEQYVEYLKKAYLDAEKALGQITRIYVSRPDMEIVKKFIKNTEVKQDLRIVVGGLIAENDGLIADYTFDKKIKGEREKFVNNTLLNID
ncbi:MAG: hypothetical protein K0S55_394 [Clostridia bacterium]|nr:hypothetical protein [Clostridia bacterium]